MLKVVTLSQIISPLIDSGMEVGVSWIRFGLSVLCDMCCVLFLVVFGFFFSLVGWWCGMVQVVLHRVRNDSVMAQYMFLTATVLGV